MKLASLFFLCLNFLLLSGSTYQRLPVSLLGNCSLQNNSLTDKQQAKPVSLSKGSFITSAGATGTGYNCLNALEPEDTDDENSRHLEWSNYYLQPSYNLLLGNLHLYHKDRLPACLHFALLSSDRYITYRVIRI